MTNETTNKTSSAAPDDLREFAGFFRLTATRLRSGTMTSSELVACADSVESAARGLRRAAGVDNKIDPYFLARTAE